MQLSNKQIIYTAKKTSAVLLIPTTLLVATILLMRLDSLLAYLSIVTFAFATAQFCLYSIELYSFRMFITGHTVIISSGIIRRHTTKYLLSKISGVTYECSYVGKLLNFGSVAIVLSGVEQPYIHKIVKPEVFCNRLLSFISTYIGNIHKKQYIQQTSRELAAS